MTEAEEALAEALREISRLKERLETSESYWLEAEASFQTTLRGYKEQLRRCVGEEGL